MKRNGSDSVMQAALEYAALGWQVVMLHAPHGGGCTCTAGRACESPGKHPRGKEWQTRATSSNEEELLQLFDKWPESNIGLLLGPRSGVVDVEFDDDEGRATAERLFADCFTPSYKSNRSVHRLFKWSAELPNIQKRVVKGLEIRIGNDGKATQSVLPPSLHPSGTTYEWLPGLSPGEVELADFPANVLSLLWNTGETDNLDAIDRPPSKARAVLDEEQVTEGGRNDKLYAFACSQARRSPNIDDPKEQSDLLELIQSVNVAKCKPPLDDDEIKKICRSAIQFIRQQRSAAGSDPKGFTIHGLKHTHGEWWPGDWHLTIILSDPTTYRLHVPAWKEYTVDGSGNVLISLEDYRDPASVAAAVQRATRKVMLDEVPRVWPSIWNGREAKRGGDGPAEPSRRGLKAKLLDSATTENPPATAKRYVIVAEYLAEKIAGAHEAERPDELGHPVRIKSDGGSEEIWFKWRKVWQDGILTSHIRSPECDELRARLGLKPSDFRYYPPRGQKRARYCVLTAAHLRELEDLTSGADRLDDAQAAPGATT